MLRRFGFSERVAYLVNGFILAVLCIVGSWVGYNIADRDPPLMLTGPRTLNTIVVAPQEDWGYTTPFIRERWCRTKVNRWWIDRDGVEHKEEPLPFALSTPVLYQPVQAPFSIKVPYNMPAGYTLWCFRPEWDCNFTQKPWIPWPLGPIQGAETCISLWVDNPADPWLLPSEAALK